MFWPLIHIVFFSSLALWPFSSKPSGIEIKKSSLTLPSTLEKFERIRISVLEGKNEVVLGTDADFEVEDGSGRLLFSGQRIASAKVKSTEYGIQIGSQRFRGSSVSVWTQGESVSVDGNAYRYGLQIWREPDKSLLIINEIPLEEYLKGVLPAEVNAKWPAEALKAQAVASRTYALFQSIFNQSERADVSAGVSSQVYGGKGVEHPDTSRAVEETAGLILTYKGKIFPAYFHATCGGATTRADKTWDVERHPSLGGVSCRFCEGTKHYRWEREMALSEIEKGLKAHDFPVSGITDISAAEQDSFGRATKMRVRDKDGSAKIRANDFRLALDPFKFKSTWFTAMRRQGEKIHFRGRGWGHGVGMCQYGNKQLAELGYSYEEILKYYFPGADIIKVNI